MVAVFQPGVYFPQVAPFRPLLTVAAAALVAWILTPKEPFPIKTRSKLNYYIVGFVAAQTISVFQFLYIPQIVDIAITWTNLAVVYFLISGLATTVQRLRGIWTAILVATSFLVIQAVWVYHTQTTAHPQLLEGRLSSYGAYSGANDLALLLVCAWPIAFKFTDLVSNRFLKFLPVPLLLLIVYADLRTISRGGLIGLALVMTLSMLRGRSLGRLGRWAMLLPAVIIIVMVGGKLLLTRKDVADYSVHDESAQRRLDAWSAGLSMLISSPIYGVGSGQFVDLSDEFGAGKPIQAHNTIVKVAAETGLLGLVCYLGIVFGAFRCLWRSWRGLSKIKPDGPERLWVEAIGISLLGFFFNTQFSVKAHEWFLYFLVASAKALEKIYLREVMRFAVKAQKAESLLADSGIKPA